MDARPQQLKCLKLIARGYNFSAIAKELGVTVYKAGFIALQCCAIIKCPKDPRHRLAFAAQRVLTEQEWLEFVEQSKQRWALIPDSLLPDTYIELLERWISPPYSELEIDEMAFLSGLELNDLRRICRGWLRAIGFPVGNTPFINYPLILVTYRAAVHGVRNLPDYRE